MTSIQNQLRQARESEGLTQSSLGERIGQPQSAVSRIERGGDLRLSTLLEMVRVLNMEPVLVPKRLIPAVQALLNHAGRDKISRADNIPLVGGAPEDAEDSE